jgi:radical SAM superfamily enzyme YgiQ (UPF0313 family)
MGEAESTLPNLLLETSRGVPLGDVRIPSLATRTCSGKNRPPVLRLPLDALPVPLCPQDRLRYDSGQHVKVRFELNRGCLYSCSYCTESPYWGNYRERSLSNAIAGLARLHQLFPSATLEVIGSGIHPQRPSTTSGSSTRRATTTFWSSITP